MVCFLLVMSPWRGELTLTMLLSVLFLVEGIAAIASGLDYRHHARNWGWPGTAAWAIGVLAGVNLFMVGLSLVMLSLAVRRQGEHNPAYNIQHR